MFSLFCWPFYATRLVFASAAEGDGERSRVREWERERDREIAYRAQVRNVNVRGTRTVRLGFWVYLQWHKQRLVHLSTTIVAWRSTIADHTHTTMGNGQMSWVHFWKPIAWLTAQSALLPLSLSPSLSLPRSQRILSHFVNGGAMEIGTISRQTPQLRQDQLIRAAKTSVIEVLIVSRGERVENWSCQWGGRGVQQHQQR